MQEVNHHSLVFGYTPFFKSQRYLNAKLSLLKRKKLSENNRKLNQQIDDISAKFRNAVRNAQ